MCILQVYHLLRIFTQIYTFIFTHGFDLFDTRARFRTFLFTFTVYSSTFFFIIFCYSLLRVYWFKISYILIMCYFHFVDKYIFLCRINVFLCVFLYNDNFIKRVIKPVLITVYLFGSDYLVLTLKAGLIWLFASSLFLSPNYAFVAHICACESELRCVVL